MRVMLRAMHLGILVVVNGNTRDEAKYIAWDACRICHLEATSVK